MDFLNGISSLGLLSQSADLALLALFNLDLFDLLFVSTAIVFNLQIMGIYIASKQNQDNMVKLFGAVVVALAVPITIVFMNHLIRDPQPWKIAGYLCILLYLLAELLVDFIYKFDFRSKPLFHIPYIVFFYLVEFSLIAIAFSIAPLSGYLVSISFWALLFCLLYSIWPGPLRFLTKGA